MRKNYKIVFIGLFLALTFSVINVEAAGLSLGPLSISVGAIRGGEYQRTLNVYNAGSEPLNVLLSVDGNAANWTYLYAKGRLDSPISNITVPANNVSEVIAVFKIPGDTPVGDYSSVISARAFLAESSVGTGIRLKSNVDIYVTGDQILAGTVNDITIKDTEINHPLTILVYFENKGNVIAKPLFDVEILKNNNSVVQSSYQSEGVGVGMPKMEEVKVNLTNQEVGDYVANFKTYLEDKLIDEENLNFKILERGTLTAQGSVLSIESPKQVDSGSVAKIEVEFVNTGQIDVMAKISGEVYSNNNFVGVLESDENLVGVGKTGNLTAYFKPDKDGNYLIKSNVIFEGKKEPMQDIIINVGKSAISGLFLLDTQTIIIIVFVATALILIVIGILYDKSKKSKRIE